MHTANHPASYFTSRIALSVATVVYAAIAALSVMAVGIIVNSPAVDSTTNMTRSYSRSTEVTLAYRSTRTISSTAPELRASSMKETG